MKSFFYAPGERALLGVELSVPEAMQEESLGVELLLYPSLSTRSSLSSFREGSRRYPTVRRILETLTPGSGPNFREYELDLAGMGLRPGVYPFEVRILQDGEPVSSDYNFLVIMDAAAGYPLNLSLLWAPDFLPAFDAQGNNLDSGLSSACKAKDPQRGFLYSLASTLKGTPEVPTSMVLPYSTYQDMVKIAALAEKQNGEGADKGAAETRRMLEEMFKSGQIDLMVTTYAHADVDQLSSLGWEGDADTQMSKGARGAEEMGSRGKGFVAPLFRLSDGMLQRLIQDGREFTVVGEEAVKSSSAGRRLLEGTTLSQPVNFVNQNGYLLKAFVRDEALYSYLESSPQGEVSHLLQNIFAELAVLQREKPYSVRSCVLVFPPTFMPGEQFLQGLYGSLKSCPWLKARQLTDLSRDQFALEKVALQAPSYPYAPTSYSQKLEEVSGNARAYCGAIPENHPLRETFSESILIAQNYRLMEERDTAAGQSYEGSIEGLLRSELSKVKIEQKRSVTLSGTQGNLSVDVTSALDYPITATLYLENNSLTFPDGNRRDNVTIGPRENRLLFSVNTHRKGSFMVEIVLEANGLVLDRASTMVKTSIINTLAIILLAALAFLVGMVALFRRLSRKIKSGKHSRGRKEP
jgi:hypothetical protein